MNKSKEVFVNTIESYPSKSKEDIINAYKKSQRNKIKHAQMPDQIPKQTLKKAMDTQADIPRKEIERIQQLLYNTEID